MNVISITKMVNREATEMKDEGLFHSSWTDDDSRNKQEIEKKKLKL